MKQKRTLLCIFLILFILFQKANAQNSNTSFNNIMGKSGLPVTAGLTAGFLVDGLISNNKQIQQVGLQMLQAAIIVEISNSVFRKIYYSKNYIDTKLFSSPEGKYINPALPSMNSSMAFSTATSISFQFKKWYYVVPSYAWAGGVMYSRAQFGENKLSNILGAAIIGTGSTLLSRYLNNQIFYNKSKRKKPVKNVDNLDESINSNLTKEQQ